MALNTLSKLQSRSIGVACLTLPGNLFENIDHRILVYDLLPISVNLQKKKTFCHNSWMGKYLPPLCHSMWYKYSTDDMDSYSAVSQGHINPMYQSYWTINLTKHHMSMFLV